MFEWTSPRETSLQIVIYSNSDQPLGYSIAVLPPAPTRAEATARSHAVVRVLFATDRRVETRRPLAFATEPADGNQISYGTCFVSVARDHRMGELEGPSIWRLEFHPNPERHVVVVSKELADEPRFFDDVRHLAERSAEHDALVFVHGFNVEFDDAARRTAQLAYDLGFEGPAITFSWPSQATLLGYNRDARNVELSAESLRMVLSDLSRKANVQRIHVIAHSMGNRALSGALCKLDSDVTIRQIALIAPDIDPELFRRLARSFPSSVGPITLYASSRDAALLAAEKFAGDPRAGRGGQDGKPPDRAWLPGLRPSLDVEVCLRTRSAASPERNSTSSVRRWPTRAVERRLPRRTDCAGKSPVARLWRWTGRAEAVDRVNHDRSARIGAGDA